MNVKEKSEGKFLNEINMLKYDIMTPDWFMIIHQCEINRENEKTVEEKS